MCSCDGMITYATHLFNGYEYGMPETDMTYRRMSPGVSVRCGTDALNQPYVVDPAPGAVKHCWCTPKKIMDLLADGTLHQAGCAEKATLDYMDEVDAQGKLITRRLQLEEEDDVSEGQGPRPRKLKAPTLVYTPWALVEVALPADQDTFSSSFGKTFQPQLTCAYQFGVPTAGHGLYHSDGPYNGLFGSDTWEVEALAKQWGNSSMRKCWVRTVGRSAEDGAPCAVAMVSPESASASDFKSARVWWNKLKIILCGISAACCCTCCCCAIFGKHATAARGYDMASEETTSSVSRGFDSRFQDNVAVQHAT